MASIDNSDICVYHHGAMSVEEKNGPPLQSLHQPHLTRTATIVDVGISSSSKKRKCDGFESSAYGQLVGKDLIIEVSILLGLIRLIH